MCFKRKIISETLQNFLVVRKIVECEVVLQNISIVETQGSAEIYVHSNFFSEVVWENELALQNLCVSRVIRNALKNRNRFISTPIFIIMVEI